MSESKESAVQALKPPKAPKVALTPQAAASKSEVKTESETKEGDKRGVGDDSCIYIDDEQILNKSDIIRSFADDVTSPMKAAANGAESRSRHPSDLDDDDADVSVTSFGSSLDDYNYYNSKLFDDDEDDEQDEDESVLDDDDTDSDRDFKHNGHGKSGR